MRVSFDLRADQVDVFKNRCQVAISKLGNGTKRATIAACEEILQASLAQVPVYTGVLASSAYYRVERDTSRGFAGEVGYGGNGNPINPNTGQAASEYAIYVHERLDVRHPVGKAKFLEDPVRDYARENFPRTVMKYASESLQDMEG